MKIQVVNETSGPNSKYDWLKQNVVSVENDCELQLAVTPSGIEIRYCDSKKLGPFKVDFETGRLGFRWKKGTPKSEPILKAIGSSVTKVLDCTAGFGRDGFLLANAGYEVVSVETNPVIFTLLQDGYDRLSPEVADKIHKLWKVKFGKWEEQSFSEFDCLYLDPMFPDSNKKSALNKKENQYLQMICDKSFDHSKLLNLGKKIVVKRPADAPSLIENPKGQIVSGSIRFDIY